jgi:hypothetical protein
MSEVTPIAPVDPLFIHGGSAAFTNLPSINIATVINNGIVD